MADGVAMTTQLYELLMKIEQRLGRIEGKQEDQIGADALAEKLNRQRRDLYEDLARLEGRVSDRVGSEMHGIARKVFREETAEQDRTLSRAKAALWTGGGAGVAAALYTIIQAFGG